jgi:SAM-dependent methyltransferase
MIKKMNQGYKEDLAYIHDVGYRDYSLKSAPGILEILARNNIPGGLIVELGCGSGLLAEVFTQVNYDYLGVDISEALIKIARERVPKAEFQVESLFKTDIPPCYAVLSIGECCNYLFDSDNNFQTLRQIFERIYQALIPGGVFIFDIAEPGQVESENPIKTFTEGDDWIVLVEKTEDLAEKKLTRKIITFRQIGNYYRRDDETHHLQLYQAKEVAQILQQIGFQVEILRNFGAYILPKAHAAFIACKV